MLWVLYHKKEPQTFKKMYGNQSGYYSLMKPLKMSKEEVNMKEHPAKSGVRAN